jgi:hypothetical protein
LEARNIKSLGGNPAVKADLRHWAMAREKGGHFSWRLQAGMLRHFEPEMTENPRKSGRQARGGKTR